MQAQEGAMRRIDLGGEDNMREHRAAATTAGVLYITATVAGVVSTVVVSAPVRDARDPLAYAVEHSGAVATAGLLTLVMGLALAFIPVVLYRVLRPIDEVLAGRLPDCARSYRDHLLRPSRDRLAAARAPG
jgi:Domain of unknown function (DUF4386)